MYFFPKNISKLVINVIELREDLNRLAEERAVKKTKPKKNYESSKVEFILIILSIQWKIFRKLIQKKIKQNKSHVKRYIIQNLQLQEELHIYHVIMEL